jgi:hypothetical protein
MFYENELGSGFPPFGENLRGEIDMTGMTLKVSFSKHLSRILKTI